MKNLSLIFLHQIFLYSTSENGRKSCARDAITQHNEKLIRHICVNNEISYLERSVSYGTFNVMLRRAREANAGAGKETS